MIAQETRRRATDPAGLWLRKLPGWVRHNGEGWGAVAVVRGLMIAPDCGGARCYATEVAFESGDYENAVYASVVNDDCQQAPVTFLEGSGVCRWHFRQLKDRERGRSIP